MAWNACRNGFVTAKVTEKKGIMATGRGVHPVAASQQSNWIFQYFPFPLLSYC